MNKKKSPTSFEKKQSLDLMKYKILVALTFCSVLGFSQQEESIENIEQLRKAFIQNNNSGEIQRSDFIAAKQNVEGFAQTKSQTIALSSSGPDNFGGRTRSILIDKDNGDIVFAGSVSGGLWKSENNGSTWAFVSGFSENVGISSMCQTNNGTIYIGTGHFQENSTEDGAGSGYSGNGIYYTSDGGGSFTHLAGTESFDNVNEVVAKENTIFIASSNGLFQYNASLTQVLAGDILSLAIAEDGSVLICSDVDGETYISTDGGSTFNGISGNAPDQIPSDFGRIEYAISATKENGNYKIYASYSASTGKIKGVFLSEDHGQTWNRLAPDYNDYTDPLSTNAFTPFSFGNNSKGMYSNAIGVNPGNYDNVILGGLDLYSWTKASDPPAGEWNRLSFNSVEETSPLFVHSNIHDIVWDKDTNVMYANDGGIGKSGYTGFYPANRNYITTQFYNVGYSAHGDIIGGSHGNGVLHNDHTMQFWQDFRQLRSGVGFTCDISFRNRNVMFSSTASGDFKRSNDRGQTWYSFNQELVDFGLGEPGYSLGGTYTATAYVEDSEDYNTTDSVLFIPGQDYFVGDEITAQSQSTLDSVTAIVNQNLEFDDTVYYAPGLTEEDTIVGSDFLENGVLIDTSIYYDLGYYDYELTAYNISLDNEINISDTVIVFENGAFKDSIVVDSMRFYSHYFAQNGSKILDLGIDTLATNVAWDTVKVQDIRQSWYAFGMGGTSGVWITRNAKHFSKNGDADWYKVLDEGAQVKALAFSPDGAHLFVGTFGGEVYRITGYNDVYASTPEDSVQKWIDLADTTNYLTKTKLQSDLIFIGSGVVTGIGINPNNPEHVVVTTGGYGGQHVWESTTALSTSGLGSFNDIQGDLPDMPAYDVVIERSSSDLLLVGTEFGLWISDDGGATWSQNTTGFANVPVYDVEQGWRTWNEGNRFPGRIYVATHGRGIWTSDDYLGLPDEIETTVATEREYLKVFPNPFENTITIDMSITDTERLSLEIYNLEGRLVKDINTNNKTQNGQYTVDLSDLNTGIYILNARTNNVNKSVKIVKTE